MKAKYITEGMPVRATHNGIVKNGIAGRCTKNGRYSDCLVILSDGNTFDISVRDIEPYTSANRPLHIFPPQVIRRYYMGSSSRDWINSVYRSR